MTKLAKHFSPLMMIIAIIIVASVVTASFFIASNMVKKETTVSGLPAQLSLTSTGINAWTDTAYRNATYSADLALKCNVSGNYQVFCDIYFSPIDLDALTLSAWNGTDWGWQSVVLNSTHLTVVLIEPIHVVKGDTLNIPLKVVFYEDGDYDFEFYTIFEQD